MFATTAGAVVGAYVAIGAAAVGLMSHVADTDLGFQLFALRMYMSTDAAKKFKIATDALGYSIDEIAWNPELLERYNKLVEDQTKLERNLGPNYEKQMRAIRDIQFEFTRMGVASQYVIMGIVSDISKAFGLGEGGLQGKIQRFTDYIINNTPEIAKKISDSVVPVLQSMGTLLEKATSLTLQFIGDISDDAKLKTGAVNLENIGLAAQHIADGLSKSIDKIKETMVWLDNLGKKFESSWLAQLTPSAMAKQGQEARAWWDKHLARPLNPKTAYDAGEAARRKMDNLLGIPFTPNKQAEAPLPGGQTLGDAITGMFQKTAKTRDDIIDAIIKTAQAHNVPVPVALAIAKNESNFQQTDESGKIITSGKGAQGVMQLMPQTARGLHVDATNANENILGGILLLQQLFKQFGNWETVIEAYNSRGANFVPGSRLKDETQKYLERVEPDAITIQNFIVQVPKDADPETYRRAVKDGLNDALKNKTKRTLAQTGGSF